MCDRKGRHKTLSYQVYLRIACLWGCILTLVALVLLASNHLGRGGRGKGEKHKGGRICVLGKDGEKDY